MGRTLMLAAALAAALMLNSCGELPGGKRSVRTSSKPRLTVTIWSSLPHRGPQRGAARAYERAIRGALYDYRYLNPDLRIRYVALDDSSAQAHGWDATVVVANARRAARNPTTVGYIGELDSGATAVALPLLNQFGVLMITPASTMRGLTLGGTGTGPGEPFQYYPSGKRTLVRLVPQDSVQAALLGQQLADDQCRAVAILNDGTSYGLGLAQLVAAQARAQGTDVAFAQTLKPESAGYRRLVRARREPCVVYAGEAGRSATRVITDVARIDASAKLYGSDALAVPSFANHALGGIDPSIAKRMRLTVPLGSLDQYPAVGRTMMRRIAGSPSDLVAPATPSAYAAAELLARCLAATKRIGARPRNRAAIVRLAVGRTHHSASLGTYSVVPRGDTTGKRYGLYVIRDGQIALLRPLEMPLQPREKPKR